MFTGTAEGVAGRAAAPPLFVLKRKIIKIKKKTRKKIFFRYILCIFFNFKQQAFCVASVLFAVIVPGPTCPLIKCHALATPSLRSAACFVLPAPAEFLSVLSDETKKITRFFKPNKGE